MTDYKDPKRGVLFVYEFNGMYGTHFYTKNLKKKLFIHDHLPLRETKEEAQLDLDTYALKRGKLKASRLQPIKYKIMEEGILL